MTPAEIRALADSFHLRKDVLGMGRLVWAGHFYGLPADAIEKVTTALRAYAALLEEREAEERLLEGGWELIKFPRAREYCWSCVSKHAAHTDRATAARLALEATNG